MKTITTLCVFLTAPVAIWGETRAQVWLSSEDMSRTLQVHDARIALPGAEPTPTVTVLPERRDQTVLGMGSSLEHTTCYNLMQLPESARRETVRRLVSRSEGAGMNLMRVCIGTPDFTGVPWYSYCDPPNGDPDPELRHFSIEKDRAYVLPVLKLALEENPDLLLYASPWSPPGWMTTTGDMIGGKLKRLYYETYARYFVRFIRAYEAEGIPVFAVTVQNEPGVDRSKETDPKWHYPSCMWAAEDERDFVRDFLGPAFKQENLATQIWSYDHNFNVTTTPDGDDPGIDYPTEVLRDPIAARFVDGVAFHGYAGRPKGMSIFRERFSGMNVYFTEGSTFGTRGALKIIDYLRNGASSYNAWVTIIDEHAGPNNGPFQASRTCVTLDSANKRVEYHFDYFMYAHFMRFVERGAVRLGTVSEGGARNAVAFENRDRSVVVVAVNPNGQEDTLHIRLAGQEVGLALPEKSVATVRFPPRR